MKMRGKVFKREFVENYFSKLWFVSVSGVNFEFLGIYLAIRNWHRIWVGSRKMLIIIKQLE